MSIWEYLNQQIIQADQVKSDLLKTSNPLQEYITEGFYLLPEDPKTGRPLPWQPIQERVKNDIQTRYQLKTCIAAGINRFYFIPRDNGYIVLNIEGIQGLERLKEWQPDFIPKVFTHAPGDTYQIYFSVGEEIAEQLPRDSRELSPGIGYIFDGKLCTAGGSITPAGKHRLFGYFQRAQRLEDFPAFRDRILSTQYEGGSHE